MAVDILILGSGWTGTFLKPLCEERSISYAATTRDGRDGSIKFEINPDSEDREPYRALPDAKTVLITFPITKGGASERLVRLYTETRSRSVSELASKPAFIQLGSTTMWDTANSTHDPATFPRPVQNKWYDRHSPYVSNPRGAAEDGLLALHPQYPTTVLNLVGLWGGARSPKNWVGKVAPTKEALNNKGSIHMIHGLDLARAILAVHSDFSKAQGQRWIISDGRVYDWWDLASAWGVPPQTSNLGAQDHRTEDEERGPHARWVRELMEETGVRALPRNIEVLGRAIDSQDFWKTFSLTPLKARLEG